MSVRAKVKCVSVAGGWVHFDTVKVYEPDAAEVAEKAHFTTIAPSSSGSIQLFVDSPTALSHFEQGKEYFVDFVPAEQA